MKIIFALGLIPCLASAVPIGASLSFDGLRNGEQVLTYYAGGFGGQGSGPGPADGISFTSGLAADATVFAFGPSAVVTAPTVAMTLDSPWSQVVSFYYVGNGTVSFYSGANASGNLLQSYALTNSAGFPFAVSPGSFASAVFTPGSGSTLRLDSITFGFIVIPEPSTKILLFAGIVLIALMKRRRQGTRQQSRRLH